MCSLVFALPAFITRPGQNDGRTWIDDEPHDYHALGAAVGARVRKALEALRMRSRSIGTAVSADNSSELVENLAHLLA